MPISPRQEALLKRTFIDFQATSEFLKRPVIFSRAEGLYLWDIDGKRYFDAIGGVFVATFWHRHPRVMEAMRRQIDTMTFSPPLHVEAAMKFVRQYFHQTARSRKTKSISH